MRAKFSVVSGGGYFKYRACNTTVSSSHVNSFPTCGDRIFHSPTVQFTGECFDGVTVTLLDEIGVLYECVVCGSSAVPRDRYNASTCSNVANVTASGDRMTIMWSRNNSNITSAATFPSVFTPTRVFPGNSICYVLPISLVPASIICAVVTLIFIKRKVNGYQKEINR